MEENKSLFSLLGPDEIECRVQSLSVQKNGVFAVLLLYIDARAAMNKLDDAFGPFGWQRSHEMIGNNLYCCIYIKDPSTGDWIKKQDVGVESAQAAEKGQASDSFKRACVNVGIGRELYTAPTIKIKLNADEYQEINAKPGAKMHSWIKFHVQDIQYTEQRKIKSVVIADANGNVRYSETGSKRPAKSYTQPQAQPKEPEQYLCASCGRPFEAFEYGGKQYSARDAYMMAAKKSADGKARCKTCRSKIEGK